MTDLEELLRSHDVLRIHRAFLVGVAHVRELRADAGRCGHVLVSDGTLLPIGRSYRQQVAARLSP
jgi:DNA-binding LytR/AlgR family response regulator